MFARGGYVGTSVLAIADRAGISDAGVLYHFSTKRELFVAVVDVFTELQPTRSGSCWCRAASRRSEIWWGGVR
ncbi:MAG: helix-turn-helix transcriptional regulator [Actinobacteria bacterium]|nr:helix-turn-helix transcriptional regulator [Actinomycetota bacterium]